MMDANNPVGEAAPPPLTPVTPASIGARLAAGLLGVLLLWLVVTRFKVALLGLLGIGVAWGVQRGRRRAYTRTAGWVGAVGVTCVALVVTFGIAAANAPPGSLDSMMKKMAQDQARQRQQPLPGFLQRMAPAQPSPAAQAATHQAFQSRGFVKAALAIGGLIASSLGGFLFGSLMWAAVTTLLYAAVGRWTFGAPAPPA
jgi:hypothetical protein